jgi:hypothetical protein
MKIVLTALKELWGLFVDDGRLAIALVAWCGVALAGGFKVVGVPADWRGALLVLGCLTILILNVLDSARRLRNR